LGTRFTIAYSGSIGSWYLSDKMADFFLQLLKQRSDAHFLWLTLGDAAMIRKLMNERGISDSQYTVQSTASADVSSYLSASDVGIAFYKPGFSKLATSPVKVTEYLACGLPLIINAGIGDSDALIANESVGALVRSFTEPEYTSAALVIAALTRDVEQTRKKSREVAEKSFDVRRVGLERYARLYEKVLLNGN
jgi:glycosyltransferase involved in cell wall biosynthesis